MAQAMLRLLAMPKTMAVRPFKSIMRAGPSCSGISPATKHSSRVRRHSAAQVDVCDIVDGAAKKACTERAELRYGIRRVEANRGLVRAIGTDARADTQPQPDLLGSDFGGVDDTNRSLAAACVQCCGNHLTQQRI